MRGRFILPSAISFALLGVGLFLAGRQSPGALATLAIVAGASVGLVTLFLWGASLRSPPVATRELAETQELKSFAHALVSTTRLAQEKGILMLADAIVPARRELFASGARLLIAGSPASEIRAELEHQAESESAEYVRAQGRAVQACRWTPVGTLIVGSLATLIAAGPLLKQEPLSALSALCVLGVIYLGFMAVGVASHFQQAFENSVRRFELTSALVIETLVGIRQGTNPDVIEQSLMQWVNPQSADAANAQRSSLAA
jgi:flagellar motor component MotA